MRIVILAICIVYAIASIHPVNDELIASIKQKADWTPMEVEENPFAFVPMEQIKAMMGTKISDPVGDYAEDLGFDPDENFDSRTAWPGKIHEIRDQGMCGSCWAFGATEALSDRFAIQGKYDVVLSPQDLVSCNTDSMGCRGGIISRGWEFMNEHGVMTDSCYPYTSGPHSEDGECKTVCADGSTPVRYYSQTPVYTRDVRIMKQHIQKYGPVETHFGVYSDFMNYKEGVYRHIEGSYVGEHAVKVLGWGLTEDGINYWIMANSWGTSWGDEGYFKIKQNNCGADDTMTFALAGDVKEVSF